MERATTEFPGQLAEGNAVFEMLLDVPAHSPNQSGLRISIHGLGAAAETGAEAGLFGLQCIIEKAYIFATRVFCRTRRPAEDARARNSKNEGAVERAITVDDGLPAAEVGWADAGWPAAGGKRGFGGSW